MAQVENRKRTPGEQVMDARIAAEMKEPIDWPYPSPATLVAVDTDFAMSSIERAAREGHAIVLFFPDGEEVVLTPSKRTAA
jgi:hypothetical protein